MWRGSEVHERRVIAYRDADVPHRLGTKRFPGGGTVCGVKAEESMLDMCFRRQRLPR